MLYFIKTRVTGDGESLESIWCSNKEVVVKAGGKEDSCVDPKDFEATDDTNVSGYPNEVALDDDDGVAEETKVIPTISYYMKLPLLRIILLTSFV